MTFRRYSKLISSSFDGVEFRPDGEPAWFNVSNETGDVEVRESKFDELSDLVLQ